MSYVLANTQNPLGRRGLGRLGWDNVPYPRYPLSRSVARLNGEFNPAGADPSSSPHGAITYRIDPRTGQYNFYRTDIKPRGVFMQNTFQHPAPPVLSALGVRVLPIGKSVTSSTIASSGLRGLGCGSCGGRCISCLSGPRFDLRRRRANRRGLGVDETAPPSADISIDPNTGCQVDSDGVILTCPTGPGGAQQPTIKTAPTDPALLQLITGQSPARQIAQGIQQITTALNPPRVVVQQPSGNWFTGKSNIGGLSVPNAALAIGGVLFAALGLEGSRKGRR